MNTKADLLKSQVDRVASRVTNDALCGRQGEKALTDADLSAVLRECGIDPDAIPEKPLALIFEMARTIGLPDVAIASARARMG